MENQNEIHPAATQVQPAALPEGLPAKAVASITNNIVVILGFAVLFVIVGSIFLSWIDKSVPEAVMVMGGVALGYLGNSIQGNQAK